MKTQLKQTYHYLAMRIEQLCAENDLSKVVELEFLDIAYCALESIKKTLSEGYTKALIDCNAFDREIKRLRNVLAEQIQRGEK